MHIDRSLSNLNQQQHSQSSQPEPSQPEQQQQQAATTTTTTVAPDANIAVPVDIKWVQGGQKSM